MENLTSSPRLGLCVLFLMEHPHQPSQQQMRGLRRGAHALAVLTEWDEFATLDFERIYEGMMKPAFVFDGRNILDHDRLRGLGFIVYGLGKPLDPFLQKHYG